MDLFGDDHRGEQGSAEHDAHHRVIDDRIHIGDSVNRIVLNRDGNRSRGDHRSFGWKNRIRPNMVKEHFICALNVVEELFVSRDGVSEFADQATGCSVLFLRRFKGVDVNVWFIGTDIF